MFSTTRLSSVVCPVGVGGLGQWDGDSLSSWNMWVRQLERIGHSQLEWINRASEIVVLGPVGEIGRTDVQSGQGQWVGLGQWYWYEEGVGRESGIKNAQIEDTTLVKGGSSISPRNWARNVWIIFGGMVGFILQANGLIQWVSGRVGTVGCKVSWRGVFMVNEAVDMVGEWIWVNVCLEVLNRRI